jgi:hypothetical protein
MKILTLVLAIFAVPEFSQETAPKRELKDRVEVVGKVVCIGCTLQKDAGAEAQCTLHSKHAQGLLDAEGRLWTFVDNGKGHIVMTKATLRDKEIKLLGWKFPKGQYIEISKYQVKEGDKWVAYDYCKTCGFEPGDNKDKDLCDDCKSK